MLVSGGKKTNGWKTTALHHRSCMFKQQADSEVADWLCTLLTIVRLDLYGCSTVMLLILLCGETHRYNASAYPEITLILVCFELFFFIIWVESSLLKICDVSRIFIAYKKLFLFFLLNRRALLDSGSDMDKRQIGAACLHIDFFFFECWVSLSFQFSCIHDTMCDHWTSLNNQLVLSPFH